MSTFINDFVWNRMYVFLNLNSTLKLEHSNKNIIHTSKSFESHQLFRWGIPSKNQGLQGKPTQFCKEMSQFLWYFQWKTKEFYNIKPHTHSIFYLSHKSSRSQILDLSISIKKSSAKPPQSSLSCLNSRLAQKTQVNTERVY